MRFKLYTAYFKRILKNFWSQKSFKFAFLIQIAFIIISFILTFTITRYTQENDFLVFYKSAEIFLKDFENLYDPIYGPAWEYRYLPLSPILFIPFYITGFEIGFVLFTIINCILNILICILLFNIINLITPIDTESGKSKFTFYISLYLIGVPQLMNYFLGQVNLYITLLILFSLYIFLKYDNIKWDFLGSLILGISVILKPITIFMIPFLILMNINFRKKKFNFFIKRNLTRLIGAILPLLLNIIVFVVYPKLWNGFLDTNFTGSNPIDINFSFSLTKIILNFFVFYSLNFNQTLIFLIILGIFGLSGFIIYIFRSPSTNSLIFGYTFGILITFISYFEVWEHHLITLIPFLIIIVFILPDKSKIAKIFIKPSFYVYNFLNVVFLGIFILTINFFPYNFGGTIFLVLNFYGLCRYCLVKSKNENDSILKKSMA
ncbi:MAG: glycosyltransferase 87 family protein [Promethearchaeota archaeon]